MRGETTRTIVAAVLGTAFVATSVGAQESRSTSLSSTYPDGLRRIIGEDLDGWSITDPYKREPKEIVVKSVNGIPVLTTTGRFALVLSRSAQNGEYTEIAARFRYVDIPAGKYARFELRAAIKDPAKKDLDDKDRVHTNAQIRGGDDGINWSASDPRKSNERVKYARGRYRFNGIGDRQLSWPERLRRIVEHESTSLRSVDETWITLRIVLRKNAYRIWFNDLLAVDYTGESFDVSGSLQIVMSPYVELASVRTQVLAPPNPIYEPVSIGHSLNASEINGGKTRRESLPNPGQSSLVNSIPFVLPGIDDRGQDHIDLGTSWFQGAYIEGNLSGRTGPFYGRWADPFSRNPARIRFRIPGGRYRAIHLIAAADDEKDCLPVVTAQFYRAAAGFPASFSAEVPLFSATASKVKGLAVRLDNGRQGNLHLVTIPIDPGMLEGFKDLDIIDVELSKNVKLYRAYPDPTYYSVHAAGLPSSVRVYAMTLERPAVEMQVTPEKYAHIFTAPEQPAYQVKLRCPDDTKRQVVLEVSTCSFDGQEKRSQKQTLTVTSGGVVTRFVLPLKRYGYHDVVFRLADGEQVWNERLSLALLQKDTRERGNWDVGRGPFFGAWNWRGGHHTAPHEKSTLVHALAGGMGQGSTYQAASEEVKEVARKYGMATLKHFAGSDHWVTSAFMKDLRTMSRQEAIDKMVESLKKIETEPSSITRTWYVSFYPEPHLGLITSGALPDYFGEPPYEFTEHEEERFQEYLKAFLIGAPEIRKRWPKAKIMMPHGDPMFTVFFLRRSEEARKYIDGVAVDVPVFERLPEGQIHQVSPHRLWMCMKEYEKAGIREKMSFPMYEGPCVPDREGGVPWREAPALVARNLLVFMGYGVNQSLGAFGVFHSGDYWGESHYGGGLMHRLPLERPKPMYVAYATITRQLNGRNFTKWLPTGSLSAYNMQFKHYKDGSLTHVLWTIRGTRPVSVTVPKGAKAFLFDDMDNETTLAEKDGKIAFTISPSPVYLQGLKSDALVTLNAPDHSDQKPATLATRIGNPGDGTWRQAAEDLAYAHNSFMQIRRYPAKMSISVSTDVSDEHGGTALAVHFEKPEKDRVIMPHYTTLVPQKPVMIPGKSSHVGLWVKASSDWGRVVYSLRDAQGERWLSVGTRNQWNCDDIHNWSVFCFDGWRYLRFEMPANSPYDTFRERGTTWWGHHDGDGIVDLPLKVEKIFVERRTHAMYVNRPVPAVMDDVLLGNLYAEYKTEQDMTDEAIRLSRIRMPMPEGVADLDNPIVDMARTGTFESAGVTKITLPEQQADGMRCYVHFDPVTGAKHYDVWVSPYHDGRGALRLGKAWTEPGLLLRGLRPETDFFLFLTVTDQDGKQSKPSKPFKIQLKDVFGMK